MTKPIVVVGTGRCGTSTVARLLHENLGVRMYKEEFLPPDYGNPLGYYEDKNVKWLIKNSKLNAADWTYKLYKYMTPYAGPWGFKLQPIEALPKDLISQLSPRKIILCRRHKNAVIKSMFNWWEERNNYTPSYKQLSSKWANLIAEFDLRENRVRELLHGHIALNLDFSFPRKEAELLEIIDKFIS